MPKFVGTPKIVPSLVASNKWKLEVTYTAEFSDFEVKNFHFREAFILWEQDSGTPDQKLTPKVAVEGFNPSEKQVTRKMTYIISGDKLDTEPGEEELYAVVYLRTIDTNQLVTKKSEILHLNP